MNNYNIVPVLITLSIVFSVTSLIICFSKSNRQREMTVGIGLRRLDSNRVFISMDSSGDVYKSTGEYFKKDK